MLESLQKIMVTTIICLTLIMMLVGCSSDQNYTHQVNGNEAYLDATPLEPLYTPEGMILPLQNNNYKVSTTTLPGSIGKQLDIRPPAQLLTPPQDSL
ncbi:outer membrane protein assembly factor BamC [Candidatus Gillettellia adelgis]